MAETRTPRFGLPAWSDEVADGPSMSDFNEAFQAIEVLAAKLTGLGRRNVLRNGDMSVAQRGVGPFTAGNVYTVDGFLKGHTGGTHTVTQEVSPVGSEMGLNGAKNFLRSVVAGQAAAGDYVQLFHRVEGVRTLAGKEVTLSFVADASTGTPKIGIECLQGFGTGGAPSADVMTAVSAVTISTSATRYTVTFTVPSIAGKTIGTAGNDFLQLALWLSAGTTFAARASSIGIQNATIDITDVQLELGPDASQFERLPQADQLAWCQRYFYRWALGSNTAHANWTFLAGGMAASSVRGDYRLSFPVRMRAAPTASGITEGAAYNSEPSSATSTGGSLTAPQITAEGSQIILSSTTGGMTTGRSCTLNVAGGGFAGTETRIDFSAEL